VTCPASSREAALARGPHQSMAPGGFVGGLLLALSCAAPLLVQADGPDRVSLMKTAVTVEDSGPKAHISTEFTFEVPAGAKQGKFFKSIWDNGRNAPVSGLAVTDGLGSAIPHEMETFDDGIVRVTGTYPSPIEGPASHTVKIQFTLENGACKNGKGEAYLSTQWTNWWKIPVSDSSLSIEFTGSTNEVMGGDGVCATISGGDCIAPDGILVKSWSKGEFTGISWTAPQGLPECVASSAVSGAGPIRRPMLLLAVAVALGCAMR